MSPNYGYDEPWMRERNFSEGYRQIRHKYPELAITVSSRPSHPSPATDREVVNMTPPSDDEVAEILRRLSRSPSDA